ncbi:unnamed protein product [Symbiodinium microadriaticum]|nr:unnamed protein product [Symbiodinium microadriaticum]
MSLRRGVLALALPVLAMVLAGCGCERDGMITCVVDKTSQSHEICGVTAYSKVMSGDTTVADCCVALKAVQDCYAVCSCDTECADEDKALACPTTGKVSDPIRFWELILAGLNKDGETCATAGVDVKPSQICSYRKSQDKAFTGAQVWLKFPTEDEAKVFCDENEATWWLPVLAFWSWVRAFGGLRDLALAASNHEPVALKGVLFGCYGFCGGHVLKCAPSYLQQLPEIWYGFEGRYRGVPALILVH